MAGRHFRILVTRASEGASELATRLQSLGAEPVVIPAIEIVPPSSFNVLDEALENIEAFDWLLFTSANAVRVFAERQARSARGSARRDGSLRVGAIGASTGRALTARGFTPDLIPAAATAEGFAEALLPFALNSEGGPGRFLLIRAEEARGYLPEALRTAGASVTIAPAYRNQLPAESVAKLRNLLRPGKPRLDAITFTSSSTVQNVVDMLKSSGAQLGNGVLRDAVLASIGPITSDSLRQHGFSPDVEAAETTVGSLAEGVMRYLTTLYSTEGGCGER